MNNIFMSNPAREIYSYLAGKSCSYSVDNTIDINDIFLIDSTMLSYYSKPIINMIEDKFKRLKNIESKHCTFGYWLPMLSNLLKYNKSAKRNTSIVYNKDDTDILKYQLLNGMQMCDYSITDLNKMFEMFKIQYSVLESACKISKNNGIYNISYIFAVASNENVAHMTKISNMNKVIDKIEKSNTILNNKVVINHSPLDMATVHHNWNETLENAELIQKFNGIVRSGNEKI